MPPATARVADGGESTPLWRRPVVKRVVLLAIAGISLYLVGPAVVELFSSWPRVRQLDPFLLQLIVLAQACAYVCLWAVMWIALGSGRSLPVITSQLAGNAAARCCRAAAPPGRRCSTPCS